jgi:hypothetical protein
MVECPPGVLSGFGQTPSLSICLASRSRRRTPPRPSSSVDDHDHEDEDKEWDITLNGYPLRRGVNS